MDGYEGDGVVCTDIDECVAGTADCSAEELDNGGAVCHDSDSFHFYA